MAHWAKIGAQCVCIDDYWIEAESETGVMPYRLPMLREVLTVNEVIVRYGQVFLGFVEVAGGYCWHIAHFRPLVSQADDVALFAHHLHQKSIQITEPAL